MRQLRTFTFSTTTSGAGVLNTSASSSASMSQFSISTLLDDTSIPSLQWLTWLHIFTFRIVTPSQRSGLSVQLPPQRSVTPSTRTFRQLRKFTRCGLDAVVISPPRPSIVPSPSIATFVAPTVCISADSPAARYTAEFVQPSSTAPFSRWSVTPFFSANGPVSQVPLGTVTVPPPPADAASMAFWMPDTSNAPAEKAAAHTAAATRILFIHYHPMTFQDTMP